jgi:hypothetical protein
MDEFARSFYGADVLLIAVLPASEDRSEGITSGRLPMRLSDLAGQGGDIGPLANAAAS